jgi:hypothetical protein
VDDEPNAGPQGAPVGRLDRRRRTVADHEDPVEAWAEPVVAVGAVLVVDSPLDVEVDVAADEVPSWPAVLVDEPREPATVATAAVVTPSFALPSEDTAASAPKPPTAAAPTSPVPIVIARMRDTARSRSRGLRRGPPFMSRRCGGVPFGFVTWGAVIERDSAPLVVIESTRDAAILRE